MSALAPLMGDTEPDPDRPSRQWSTDQHLIASMVDALTMLHHTYLTAHSKTAPPQRRPMYRPGTTRAAPLTRPDPAQVEALRTRNRGGAPDGN